MKARAKKDVSLIVTKGTVLEWDGEFFVKEGEKRGYKPINLGSGKKKVTYTTPNFYNEETVKDMTDWFEVIE